MKFTLGWIALLLAACSSSTAPGNSVTDDVLTVSITGSGHVTSSGGFIDCPVVCSHSYRVSRVVPTEDVPVELTATPAVGWAFTSWGGSCAGNASTTSAVLDQGHTINCIAVFALAPPDLSGTWTLYDNATTVHSPSETTTIAPFTGTAFTGTNNVAGTIRDITGTSVGTAVNWTRWADVNHTQCHEKETLTADLNANPKTMTGNIVDCTGGLGRAVLWKHN